MIVDFLQTFLNNAFCYFYAKIRCEVVLKMKKIALVVSSFDILVCADNMKGGGSVVLKNLLAQWIKDKNVVLDVYCSGTTIFEWEGINKIIQIPIYQFTHIDEFNAELKKYVEVENYDNVLFGDVLSPYGSVMLQSHSYPYRYDIYGKGIKTFLFKLLGKSKIDRQKRLFGKENKIFIAMSEKIKEDYSKNFNIEKDRIKVVYPGVNMPEKMPKTVDDSSFTFGIVAGSNFNKGAYRFLFALARLKNSNKNLKAIMICKRYEKLILMKSLVWILGLKNSIQVFDFNQEMNKFYKSIDCLVVPSRHDAFALVVLEAGANGTVSLVSSNVGASELIIDGENGFIFDISKNVIKNLAEKMQIVIDIKTKSDVKFNQLQDNAFKLATEYTWKKFADKVLESL